MKWICIVSHTTVQSCPFSHAPQKLCGPVLHSDVHSVRVIPLQSCQLHVGVLGHCDIDDSTTTCKSCKEHDCYIGVMWCGVGGCGVVWWHVPILQCLLSTAHNN